MTRGTLALVTATLGLSALTHFGALDLPLVVDERTLSDLSLWTLVTNSLVTIRTEFLGFALFLVIAAFLFWERIRMAWYVNRVQLLMMVGLPLGALFLLDSVSPRGVIWGMASAAVMLVWFATAVERRWGTKRLLVFCLTIGFVTNLFAAVMVAVWPTSIVAALGNGVTPFNGVGPITYALLTVWCLMNGNQYFALLRIEVRKLIWVLVAFAVINFLFEGRLAALMDLLAIGLTCLLVYGLWRPQHLIDRARLWWIERRVNKRRSRMRSIDGGRDH